LYLSIDVYKIPIRQKNNKDDSEFKVSDAIYTASFTDAFSDVGSILLITVNGHE